ncbi:MAG: hypothetical protein RSO15_17105 [Bacteroides sp.]|uniref:hypothetical protein n=1 Tax=Bacteroides sp. TaxID=29523 RepID=UPI002FCA3FAA
MKPIVNKTITPQQLRALQSCFSKLGFDDEERHGFVAHFTDGRTSSSKELSFDEARRILSGLKEDNSKKLGVAAKKLVGEIYGLSLKISFLNKDYCDTDTPEDFEMNKAKLNVFARTRSACRKNITKMSLDELKAFKKQLEAILHKENK